MAVTPERFASLVDRWVDEGLVTPAQAARMRADLVAEPAARRGPSASVVGEALGYLGGAIVLVGALLIGAWYWDDLGTALRVSVLVGAALALLAAGALVESRGSAGTRLRSVLWLISTGAAAGALAVLVADVSAVGDADRFVAVAGGTTVYATGLWLAGRGVVQQAAMVVAFALTVVALLARADLADDLPGLGAWVVGVGWAAAGWLEHARPGRAVVALASVLALVGAMSTAGADAGMVLALLTVVGIVVGAVVRRDLLLLAVGTTGAVLNIPAAMTRWFPDSVAAAFGLVVVGVVLLLAAVWIGRRSGRPPG